MKKKKRISRKKSVRKSDKSDTIKKGISREKKIDQRIREKQKLFLELFMKRLCNVARTCKAVNISRETYYDWMKRYPRFRRSCQEAREGLIDELESHGYRLIFEEGDGRLLIFYLCNLGKERGWSNRHMIEGNPDMPLTVVISDQYKPKAGEEQKGAGG